ncbi:MAG: 4Fe-4S ferredoxin [Methanomassiliicoccales archaeon]|nr:4Fe-4S ferredoxin [Methanomassiliicoccales archaeon]
MVRRKIIRVDEAKCTGCGECAITCAEGAIEIIDGKAKVINEVYCDGLGACIGECPEGALTIEEREAPEFDEHKVKEHLSKKAEKEPHMMACPGSGPRRILAPKAVKEGEKPTPQLSNWPVQLRLAHAQAPYFKRARLLIAADCSAFAYAAMHSDFIKGRVTVIACPKLDDNQEQIAKLTDIFSMNDIQDIKLVRMEVPCCGGLKLVVKKAMERAKKRIPLEEVVVAADGSIIEGSVA